MKPIKLTALLLTLVLVLAACTPGSGPETAARTTEAVAASQTHTAAEISSTAAPDPTAPPSGTEETAAPESTAAPETGIPPEERPPVEMEELSDPVPAGDYAALLAFLGNYNYNAIPPRDPEQDGGDFPGGDSGIELTGFEPEVPGVVRPARVCSDGACLYLLDSYGLTILSAAGEDSRMLCSIPVERESNAYLEEMFVGRDRVGVVYTCSSFGMDADGNWYDTNSTHLVVYDTTDKTEPVRLRDSGIEGSYLESRMIGDRIYLLTNRYYWSVRPDGAPEAVVPAVTEDGASTGIPADRIWLCPNPNSTALTVAAALSLEDGSILDSMAFTDATTAVFVEADAIWLARPVRQYGASAAYADGGYSVTDHAAHTKTELKRLSLREGLALDGVCLLDGGVIGRCGMGRTDAGLCAATAVQELEWSVYSDEARGWSNTRWGETRQGDLLTVTDENLRPAGRLECPAEDGRITACRFSDSMALLMTEDRVRPVDLSDPKAPAAWPLADDLSPEEVSALLPDSSVFSIRSGEKRLRLRLLFRTEEKGFAVQAEAELSDAYGSPAQNDGSLLLLDSDEGWLGFALDGNADIGYRYVLVRRTGEGFSEPVVFELPYLPTNARGLILDGVLYICSSGSTYAADPETGRILTTVSSAEG